MHFPSIITSLFAIIGLTSAAATQSRDVYHGVTIAMNTTGLAGSIIQKTMPVKLGVLYDCYGQYDKPCSAERLNLLPEQHQNVDIEMVECLAYQDFGGQVPGSYPFNVHEPAMISPKGGPIGSILCYIAGER